ncbi:MAG: hypothetical protein IJ099_07490 [Alphaproteobacteria bacterium]|nr:hypothetical protein [Alphaproteobacteria bacterium]
MTLKQSSRPVDANCVVYCDRQANFYLDCTDAVLVRLYTSDGKCHFVWQSESGENGTRQFYPAFYNDTFELANHLFGRQEIEVNEIFCYNGECYYLSENEVGTKSIRLINMYSDQKIIEQIALFDDIPQGVDYICLNRIYEFDTCKKSETVAWTVFRGNICDHIPVLEQKDCNFTDIINGRHIIQQVNVGEVVILSGKVYVLQKDNDGLYLAKSNLQISNKKVCH